MSSSHNVTIGASLLFFLGGGGGGDGTGSSFSHIAYTVQWTLGHESFTLDKIANTLALLLYVKVGAIECVLYNSKSKGGERASVGSGTRSWPRAWRWPGSDLDLAYFSSSLEPICIFPLALEWRCRCSCISLESYICVMSRQILFLRQIFCKVYG
jgi:hypothetical protein